MRPLFGAAARLGIGFYPGYAELVVEDGAQRRFNTSILVDETILVDKTGAIVGRYRKVHPPGTAEVAPGLPCQHLEKRYFEVGDRQVRQRAVDRRLTEQTTRDKPRGALRPSFFLPKANEAAVPATRYSTTR